MVNVFNILGWCGDEWTRDMCSSVQKYRANVPQNNAKVTRCQLYPSQIRYIIFVPDAHAFSPLLFLQIVFLTLYSILHHCARRSRYQQITMAALEATSAHKYLMVGASYIGSSS